MRTSNVALLFVLGISMAGGGLTAQEKKLPPGCITASQRGFPKEPFKHLEGPFKVLPGECYKGSPVLSFQINEDGSVSNVKIIRSSGVRDIDKQTVKTIRGWKYELRPGCALDVEMSITIDWI